MSTTRTEIQITATDKTAAAFAAVRRNMRGLGDGAASMGISLRGVLAVLGTASIGAFVKNTIDIADNLSKMAQKTGIAASKLSEYKYAADLAGASIDDVQKSLSRLAMSMQDAIANPASESARAFQALGISVRDANGNMRSTSTVFEQIADKFAASADGPEKAAISMRLLGKSGTELIPFLNSLREGTDEAKRLGRTISDDFAKQSEVFNDNIERMGKKIQAALIPVLNTAFRSIRKLTGDLDLEMMEEARANLGMEYTSLTQAGLSANSARALHLLKQIDEIDVKIIEANRKLQSQMNADKAKKPRVADLSGPSDAFTKLMQELQKTQADSQIAVSLDEKLNAQRRIDIFAQEMRTKIELSKISGDERIKVEQQFAMTMEAKARELSRASRTPFEKLKDDWIDTGKQMEDATAKWAQASADLLTDFVMTGKLNFKDFAQSIIRDLIKIRIQTSLVGLFNKTKGSDLGSLFSGFLGMFRADGGPVSAGRPYIVGERGPELMVPGMSGTVVPNDALGGGQTVIYQTIQLSTGVQQTVRAEVMQMMPQIAEQTKRAVAEDRRRGSLAYA